ncbi:hypothetical protein ACA910_017075 [Epithemia clementina (nom. ined.)]
MTQVRGVLRRRKIPSNFRRGRWKTEELFSFRRISVFPFDHGAEREEEKQKNENPLAVSTMNHQVLDSFNHRSTNQQSVGISRGSLGRFFQPQSSLLLESRPTVLEVNQNLRRGAPLVFSSRNHRIPASILPGRSRSFEIATSGGFQFGTFLGRNEGSLLSQHQSAISFFSTAPSHDKGDDSAESQKGPPKPKVKIPSRKIERSKIPTPDSSPPIQENPLANLPEPKSLIRKGSELMISLIRSIALFLWKLPGNIIFYTFNHSERNAAITKVQDMIKHEVNHYWVGTKLLWADIRTARDLLNKTLRGNSLTRRERKQLLRTVSDLFRLVPFSMFVIIPFMEFALPFALRIFPNLLPSTFQDSLKAEENMKRELKSRIAMAQFFQETLEELAQEQKRKAKKQKEELLEAGVELSKDGRDTIDEQEDSAASMLEFLQKAQNGEMIPPDVIIRYAKYFQDDLTLDNMPRMQLINMCKYMGIPPYGTDAFLRFQLRHRIRVLKEDDQRILWEGIDSLTKMELREACQERGMRSTGLSKDAYKDALQQWLDLSVSKNVPISLLIMSRTFFLREDVFQNTPGEKAKSSSSDITGLADTISGLDKEVLNEVILQVATLEEKKSDPTIQKLKLAVLDQQNELIREEQEARDAAAALKKAGLTEKEAAAAKETMAAKGSAAASAAVENAVETATSESTPSTSKATAAPRQEKMQQSEKPSAESEGDEGEKGTEEEERDLSTEEMDALRHLLSDDPVSKEREDLAKLKATMKSEGEKESAASESSTEGENGLVDKDAAETKESSSGTAEVIHPVKTKDATSEKSDALVTATTKTDRSDDESEYPEDPLLKRLKKRIESMVDKIEVQLSDVKVKIGDKLHFLDKDRDGILSREEVASVLQQVFKRELTLEEAMEITNDMDANQDGFFSVEELLRWIDETRLVKFVEEGREADLDRIMNDQTSEPQKDSGDAKQS